MGDSLSGNFNIDEYIKKFGCSKKFINKILSSIHGKFNIVNAKTFEVEISNSKDFVPGIKCYEMIRQRDNKCSEECILRKIISSKKSEVLSCIHNNYDKPIEIYGHPIFNKNGEVVSIILHEIDISEREKIKENYEMLYDNLEDGFSLNEMIYENGEAIDWTVLKANEAYKNVFGNHAEGMRASEINRSLFAKYTDHFEKAIRKNKILRTKAPIKFKERYYDFITFKAGDDKFVNLVRDVTDKQNENNLVHEMEERFLSILQNSQDLVYRYNFKEDKFDYVSESVYTILGYPLGEFMKLNKGDFNKRVHPEDRHLLEILDSKESESSYNIEYRFERKDGRYIWLRVKKVVFRDEDGNLAYSVSDIVDITSEKLIEEEKAILEEKIIQIKNLEMEERERVALTDKEKLVLWGLCKYPLLNDEELASRLGIKRSTLTAIKNRLKSKRWFSMIYVPNFYKLGCQFFSIFGGNLIRGSKSGDMKMSLIKETPEIIFNNYQDDKFFGIFISDRYVSFKKFIDSFSEDNRNVFKLGINNNEFFFGLDNIELWDTSSMINILFDLGMNEKSDIYTFNETGKLLNTNEKRVLLAMLKDSNMSSTDISKKVWISKPTVIKIRKKLVDEGYLYPFVIPDLKKLGFPYIAKFTFELDSDVSKEIWKNEKNSRIILRVVEKKKLTKFMFFSSESEYNEEVETIQDIYRRSGIFFKLDSKLFPLQKRSSNNFNMSGFIEDLLFREEV